MEELGVASATAALPAQFSHLSVTSLSVRIEGQQILQDVSLEVSQGEIVGLLGRDGAGKTCCFDAIAGLSRPNHGQVRLNGIEVTGWSIDRRARAGLAYLCEDVSIFRGLTVEENILAALELGKPINEVRAARLRELLHDLQLDAVRLQRATTISGGERRRCEVARALAMNPAIILLDEPFRGLDPFSIRSTKELITSLKRSAIGVLISDYDVRDLVEVMDRAYVLHGGEVIFGGSTAELLANDDVRRFYLGKTFIL
jgi:lipopolysaccharide export system ATP-binding protein